jgi:hypothetical protein
MYKGTESRDSIIQKKRDSVPRFLACEIFSLRVGFFPQAEVPPLSGLLAVAGEDVEGEAGEAAEVPPAAGGAAVVEGEEGALSAADDEGAATPKVVWPRMVPGLARSPSSCPF